MTQKSNKVNKKNPGLKFFKKLTLILLPIYIIWFIYIESMPLYYNQANNTRWYFIKKCLDKKVEIPKIDILFLGESRVNAAIDFNEIQDSYSFASGGSTPIEMYYILKKYTAVYGKPDTVFLSISPRFLSEIFAFYPYAVRNDLFSFNEFKEIRNEISKNDTTLGKHIMLKYLLYKMNYIEYYQTDVLHNFVLGAYDENKSLIEEMMKMKGGRVHPGLKDSCSDLNYETNYPDFYASPILTAYFDKIFAFCQKEKIHVIFDFIPVNESSYKMFNPKFTDEYKRYIQEFAVKYPEHDISDSVFYYQDCFFGDESHMNSKGKIRYTQYLISKYFNKKTPEGFRGFN